MRENKFNMLQPENTRHALRRAVVAGLAGTLLLMLAMVVAPTPSSARVSVGDLRQFRPARPACLHAAALPGSRLHVDARLLGLGPGLWILLGAGHLGAGSLRRRHVDTRLLGLL